MAARRTKDAPLQEFHQGYSPEEDRERTNVHYEQPVEFFSLITGGEWNVYSCNWWASDQTNLTDPATITASQAAKLDIFAQQMHLQPGQRILDVGCGWGGPITYLAQKYGVRGVGLNLSPKQKVAAEARVARYGVDVRIIQQHWADFTDSEGFDAVYTDEVIVHFHDLDQYFAKVHSVLRPGGWMLNKELHNVHPDYGKINRTTAHINEIYGFTGNYRSLGEELTLANNAGFEVQTITQFPREHYLKTVGSWIANMDLHKTKLVDLVGLDYFKQFLVYLKIVYRIFTGEKLTIDAILSRKIGE
ncbi:MAG: class I SAM-dependent methyltransferase [Ktedonobacterales bacterium]|nr:class I SAM-dependent methyltransferase [Ktedonobacterales bacterium]